MSPPDERPAGYRIERQLTLTTDLINSPTRTHDRNEPLTHST
ncbi:hypothetical protein HSB1_40560 [Halogranum salarium B-1]|uniref:Uncharacterized protein n=1 Tax=Halogranum salarium B-1 TaxID=1210908 RepID=J2ZAM7_9EURY|nr:hypothetical protein HSB1_40560 [Halogranum salarium B-1]